MTKLIKRKGLLFLMAIAVMVAMMSVACKNKSTAVSNFMMEEPPSSDITTLTPSGTLTIADQTLSQFAGKYFKSKEYNNTDGTKFRYEVYISIVPKEQNGGTAPYTKLEFKGYDYQGNPINKNYQDLMRIDVKQYKGVYEVEEVYKNGPEYRAKATFSADGWLKFKPAGFNFTVELALADKN